MARNLRLLGLFHFLTDLDFFAPVGVIYFSRLTHSFALGMSIVSWMMLFAAIFEVPTGIFSDMIGRKKTMICSAVSAVLSALSLTVGTAYIYLFLSAIFAGLSRAFQSGNNEAFIYETLQESGHEGQYHHFLGKLSSVFQIALISSAVLGSYFASLSFQFLIWIAVLPKIGMFLTSLFFTDPKVTSAKSTNIYSHTSESIKLFRKNAKLKKLTIAMVIQFAIGESAYAFRALFVQTLWPLWAIGIANALSNVTAAISYFWSGKIIDRFGAKTVLFFEVIFNRIVNLTALLFPAPISPALMGMSSITYGVGDVARKNLSQLEFGAAERATMASLIALAQSILFAVASFALGLVADWAGPAKALILAHILLLTPLWFYNQIFRAKTNA